MWQDASWGRILFRLQKECGQMRPNASQTTSECGLRSDSSDPIRCDPGTHWGRSDLVLWLVTYDRIRQDAC